MGRLTSDQSRRERLVHRTIAVMIPAGVAAALTNFLEAQPEVATVFTAAACLGAGLYLFITRYRPPLVVSGNLAAGLVFATLAGANLISGGFGLPAHFAMGLVPMVAIITAGARSAATWMVLCLLEIFTLTALHAGGYTFMHVPENRDDLGLQTMGALVTLFAVAGLALAYENLKKRALGDALAASRTAEAAAREAGRASLAKSEFLANMSHEIRTPMNGIVGALELLREADAGVDPSENIELAHRSALALLGLLDDIIDLSKIEAGKLEFEAIPTELRTLLTDVVSVMKPLADEGHVELALELSEDVPEYAQVDPLRIRQVVTNLISNAIKFTPRGAVTVSVGARTLTDGTDDITVSVRDTGVGIPAAALPHIFDNFSQADSSTTREFGGAGLGLAISRRLARMMNGDLKVESEVGRGSVFRFCFPALRLSRVEAEHTPALRPDPVGLRVLVADDNEVNRLVATRMLQKLGHATETAADGAEAVARIEGAHPAFDLVLMDCQMPVMDGYAAARAIRRLDGPVRDMPILAATGNAMRGDWERCIAAGMSGYISKPITLERLRLAIAEVSGSA